MLRSLCRNSVRALATALVALAACEGAKRGVRGPLTVYAASDLALAFEEIVPLFQRASGDSVRVVLGSTGNLTQQIEQGAPADVFFAANVSYIEQLRGKDLIAPESQRLYARGRIVLATSERSGIRVQSLTDLLKPEVRKVAIANPAHAPYGLAAREAMQAAGVWTQVEPKLVLGENIRQALQFVESGAADAGIIALSLAQSPGIVTAPIADSLHRPIDQAAAVIRSSQNAEAGAAFIAFVVGPEGQTIMMKYGFVLPAGAGMSSDSARPAGAMPPP